MENNTQEEKQEQQQQQPATQPQSTTVIIQQPMVVQNKIYFSKYPQAITCAHCNVQVTTRVKYDIGGFTVLLCFILFFLVPCCQLGCCLIPFCVDGCKNARHYCPNCNNYAGSYAVF